MENIKSLNKNSINKAHLIKTANENHEKSISVSLHLEPLDSCVFIPTTHGLDRFAKGAGIKGIRKTHGFFLAYIYITPFFFSVELLLSWSVAKTLIYTTLVSKIFYFYPEKIGEMIQFHSYFSNGWLNHQRCFTHFFNGATSGLPMKLYFTIFPGH